MDTGFDKFGAWVKAKEARQLAEMLGVPDDDIQVMRNKEVEALKEYQDFLDEVQRQSDEAKNSRARL